MINRNKHSITHLSKKVMNYTPTQLKQAYQIVNQDLFNQLTQAPAGATIKLGKLGKFTKTEQMVHSKQYGRHVYYKLSFRCFSQLKTAFHRQLSKKYRLN